MSNEEESPDNQDLDAFLISVESKLRGPFSSLDMGRAIASTRSPREYLQSISKVLPRMGKVVQLRVLVGLLGVDPSEDTDDVIFKILTEAQEAPLHEEWVRVAAGLVQGILFSRDAGERDMGEEAQKLLEKTCQDILSREPVATDTDPLFAPYYYSLLNPDTLQRILPECMSNPHFSANENAEILKRDETLEQEEQPASASRLLEEAPASALPPVIMPGRSTMSTLASKPKQPASKTSMFIPNKKPASATGGRLGRQLANMRNPGLHTRKAGAAQTLLGKSRRLGQTVTTATGSSGGSATGTLGTPGGARAMKYGHNRSKMKMIDVSEVQGLTKERQERAQTETSEQKMSARKRKIMEAAAAKGLVSDKGIKRSKPNEQEQSSAEGVNEQAAVLSNAEPHLMPAAAAPDAGPGSLEATAAAALLAYQQHHNGGQPGIAAPLPEKPQNMPTSPTDRMALAPGNKDELKLLLEKSNKLSEENRFRIKQFWIDRFNPTPDVPVYRMKLHEEKILDPDTGTTVKETDYLELDYNTFAYKKLRKTKKK